MVHEFKQHSSMVRQRVSGFSLIELAIVLVIIGLLIGGVLAGQSIIRVAQLNAVGTEYQRYSTAVAFFRKTYNALPGDMATATKYWGASSACPGTAGTGTQTCNGNGNGVLNTTSAPSQYSETFTFWQHLANAGLIEGTYTGMAESGGTGFASVGGTNTPKSKFNSGIWYAGNDVSSGLLMFPVAVARHNFRMGGEVLGSWPAVKILTAQELQSIDTKLDDGLPGQGIVTSGLTTYSLTQNCATTSVASTAAYNLTLSTRECILIVAMGL